jgi:hypothetical protein
MATRAEMRVEIVALAEAQGQEIPPGDLDRMNHTDMTALLEAFRAQAATVDEDSPVSVDDDESAELAAEDEGLRAPPPTTSPLTAEPTKTVDGVADKPLGGPPPKGGVKQRWPYVVAAGRAVTTSRRGTIGAFAAVRASDFSGGQEQLDELVASGHVTRKT